MDYNTQTCEQYNSIGAIELLALAEADNPHAQLDLAYRLFEGVHLDDDFLEVHGKDALFWFENARTYLEKASQTFMKRGDLLNSAQAEFNLGSMLTTGSRLYHGMHVDFENAYQNYESAAEKFSAAGENESECNAYINLGILEYRFVEADPEQQEKFYPGRRFSYQNAFSYIGRAVECGSPQQLASMVNGLNDYARVFGVNETLSDTSRESLRRFVDVLKKASAGSNVHWL